MSFNVVPVLKSNNYRNPSSKSAKQDPSQPISQIQVSKQNVKEPISSHLTLVTDRDTAINLKKQSLHVTAPSASSQFLHHISLLTSRTDSQRKDSLSYLTSVITNHPANTPLEQPMSHVLPKLVPLILDANNDVRAQLVKLFRSFPSDETGHHVEQILPYIRAGMCHLATAVRSSSLDVLGWALDVAGQDLVAAPGGWLKMLKTFLVILHCPLETEKSNGGWSSEARSLRPIGIDDRALTQILQILSSFIHQGLSSSFDEAVENCGAQEAREWPFRHVQQHRMPRTSNAFRRLNLFGSPHTDGNEAFEDRPDRQAEFQKWFRDRIEKVIAAVKKEGGELGRAAAKVEKAVIDGMSDFEDPELAPRSTPRPPWRMQSQR